MFTVVESYPKMSHLNLCIEMRLFEYFQTTVIHLTHTTTKLSKTFFFLFSRLGNHHGLTGFPGLFLAALTAQSLSLVSTGYNKILTNLWNLLKVVRIHTMITLSPSKGNKKIIFSSPLSLTFALWGLLNRSIP